MTDGTLFRILCFVALCLAVGMVTGATRASTMRGVLRESLKAFVSLAGGIVLLCVALQLLLSVVQT